MDASLPDHLVLFDGVCNFCNSTVQRIIRNDKKNVFYFASLQSDIGQKILDNFRLKTNAADTIVYIRNGIVFTKSDAALQIAGRMKFPFPVLCLGFIVPRFLRNIIYDYIAKNRYKWFGKSENCVVPTEEQKKKFIS